MTRTRSCGAGARRAALALAGAGAVAAAAAHVWSRYVEIHRFTVREHELRILPPGTRPVRILHVSDAHLMPDQDRKIAFLRHLETLKPHLVIDTGDNIASAASIPVLADAIEPLLHRPGAFAMGSNDMFAPHRKNPLRYFLRDPRPEGFTKRHHEPDLPLGSLRRVLTSHGWKDLTNTRASLRLTGLQVDLVGVDDPHLERDEFPAPDAARDAARGATGEAGADGTGRTPAAEAAATSTEADEALAADVPHLRIGVAHAPYQRVLDAFVDDGAQLIFAGHTHGGQLRMPGVGALVTNCDLPRAQARGLSTWRGVPLNVSGGLGANPYSNFRFANPPEATLLTLRPQRR
ncbi:metallophosphoesterase [Brachybacterium halotolerans subsp. kimchii]|uniref:metallophosphoesterase n=1 Tax=Brachybacterium halotolerans TaxID=2795215 RepID=UPI001E5C7DDF|nr:metallophosphoesterase [Brachybacterium halotolerans]UEJ84135.1 metallophosphoesterase [Brachybacterium halotolerans subsp. kimchii]